MSCANEYAGTSLAGFIAAGENSYPATECLSSAGESFTIAATAHITSVALNFEGATVAGTSTVTGAMLSIGARSSITRLTLRQGYGSSNGIDCNAACTITATTVEGMRGNGIFVSGPASDGSVIGGTSAATEVSTVGTLMSGLMFNHDADVRVGYVTSSYDSHNGVFFNFVSASCSATSITATDLGQPNAAWGLSTNDSGAGLALVGTTGCWFGSVVDSGNGGYGLDVAGSSHNTFANVWVSGEARGELNSGINIATDSADNTIETARVSHEATGVDIGDNGVRGGHGEAGNDHNAFGTLYVSGDSYGSVSITGGEDNTFSRIIGTDEGNDGTRSTFYLGLIQFQYQASPVSGNVVSSASFTGAPEQSWDTAHYIVYADADASGNSVTLAGLSQHTYSKSPCLSFDTTNRFSC